MEHHCPKCGREQPHDQLCYFCREQERLAKAIALTDEEMKEKADKYKISRRYTDCREMLRALPEIDAVSVWIYENR